MLEQVVDSPITCATCKCKVHINKCTLENANNKVCNVHYKLSELNPNSKMSYGLKPKNIFQTFE
jgi:hypothetical protein